MPCTVATLGGRELLEDTQDTIFNTWNEKLNNWLHPDGFVVRELMFQNQRVMSPHATTCTDKTHWTIIPTSRITGIPSYALPSNANSHLNVITAQFPAYILGAIYKLYYSFKLECLCDKAHAPHRAYDMIKDGVEGYIVVVFLTRKIGDESEFSAICKPVQTDAGARTHLSGKCFY